MFDFRKDRKWLFGFSTIAVCKRLIPVLVVVVSIVILILLNQNNTTENRGMAVCAKYRVIENGFGLVPNNGKCQIVEVTKKLVYSEIACGLGTAPFPGEAMVPIKDGIGCDIYKIKIVDSTPAFVSVNPCDYVEKSQDITYRQENGKCIGTPIVVAKQYIESIAPTVVNQDAVVNEVGAKPSCKFISVHEAQKACIKAGGVFKIFPSVADGSRGRWHCNVNPCK